MNSEQTWRPEWQSRHGRKRAKSSFDREKSMNECRVIVGKPMGRTEAGSYSTIKSLEGERDMVITGNYEGRVSALTKIRSL
jgi:hypothetical protein